MKEQQVTIPYIHGKNIGCIWRIIYPIVVTEFGPNESLADPYVETAQIINVANERTSGWVAWGWWWYQNHALIMQNGGTNMKNYPPATTTWGWQVRDSIAAIEAQLAANGRAKASSQYFTGTGDATLSSLSFDAGVLNPDFNSDSLNYILHIADNSGVPVASAVANNQDASVSVQQAASLADTVTVTVISAAQDDTNNYRIILQTYTPAAAQLSVDPSSAAIKANNSVSLTGTAIDQYGETINNPDINWYVNGGGTLSTTTGNVVVFTSDGSVGDFTVTAYSGSFNDTCTISVTACEVIAVQDSADWTVLGPWGDQGKGTLFRSNTDDMIFEHRRWGSPWIYGLNEGIPRDVISGQKYTVSFDYKDDPNNPLYSMQVGMTSNWSTRSPNTWDADSVPVDISGFNASTFTSVSTDIQRNFLSKIALKTA